MTVVRQWIGRFVALALVGLLLLLVAPVASVGAQEAEVQEAEVEAVDVELTVSSVERDPETGEVTAEIIVPVALAGEPLSAKAVTVLIGAKRQDVDYAAVSSDDLEVVLVIDVSGSMRGAPIDAAKAAASSFIDLLPSGVEVAIVAFDDEASVIANRLASRDELQTAISALEVGGDTALFDALIVAESAFSDDPATRRVVVALSDGGDSASIASLEDAKNSIIEGRIEPFAVALATSETATENLEQLVAGTEGRVERTESADALVPLYNELATQLANRFIIRFTPSGNDPGKALVLVNAEGILAGSAVGFETASVPIQIEIESKDEPVQTRTITPLEVRRPEERTSVLGSSLVTSTARNIGIASLAITIFVLGLLISIPSERMSLIADRSRTAATNAQVSDLTGRLEGAADRFLVRKGRDRRLARSLERAGIALRPAEFVVFATASSLTVAMVIGLLFGLVVGFVVFWISVFIARAFVGRKARKRSAAFVEQLPATLQLMAGGLRAGYALSQVAEHVANETDSPTSDEFHRLSTEHRLGRDFSESIHAMADRIGAEDFRWVVQAIDIHREVGGDLAEVLDNVNATMRDRSFIRRQFAAVSAEGRYSAYLIVSLPFVVTAVLMVTNPDYIGKLTQDARGYATILIALSLVAVGSAWMKSLMKVRF